MKVKIYTKSTCPFCQYAKDLFKSHFIAYEEHVMDAKLDELQQLKVMHEWSTVPMIFIDEKLIGGFSELQEAFRDGSIAVEGYHKA